MRKLLGAGTPRELRNRFAMLVVPHSFAALAGKWSKPLLWTCRRVGCGDTSYHRAPESADRATKWLVAPRAVRHRSEVVDHSNLPFVGVAAWTSKPPPTTLIASIRRVASGPKRRELVALPESEHEVETAAADMAKPNTVLLGSQATETNFKRLPLDRYNVIHLALHGLPL